MVVEGVEVYAGRVGNNKYCDGVEKGRLHHPSGLDHLITSKQCSDSSLKTAYREELLDCFS